MISRYRRKPVTQILQVQTLMKDASKHHPLPEDLEEATCTTTRNHPSEPGSLEICKSAMSEGSNCPIITATGAVSSESTVQSNSVSTDSSSVTSWGFDEYDQAATFRVQQLFKDIDELLYGENTGVLVRGLQQECQEWSSYFPHLRILGEQIVIPTDDGYGWYASSLSSSESPSISSSQEKDFTELNILGTKAPFFVTTASEDTIYGKTPPDISSEKCIQAEVARDDVNVSEGIMEEYLAFDCRDMEEELYERNLAFSFDRLTMGRPPISPFFCMKNALLGYLFDDVWREVVSNMGDLILKYWQEYAGKKDLFLETSQAESLSHFHEFETLPSALPRMPLPKMQPVTVNTATRSQASSTGPPWSLNSIMTIQGIPLQHRNMSLMDKSYDLDEMQQLRPSSSAMISSKPWSGFPQEHSASSLSHFAQNNRRRNPPRILHPISSSPSSRSVTPRMDEVVRGTRLVTGNDQRSASPVPFNRNNLLPPIGTTTDSEHASTSGSQRQLPDTQSRSVMDHSNQRHIRRGSPSTDSVTIGVKGISLGRSSSHMASSPHHPRGHSTNDEEEKDDRTLLGPPLHGSVKSHSRGGPLTRSRPGI
ncbi:primary cilium assembly protein FAM149B1 isoform X2 [Ambystoma mexicanum]|uniref:primary cilium assembly protein FAM149B1 isoform X2 n=1 Tax=Ambystoma mexicanum TaxID=8296 RepID=UPI0037E975E4